MKMPKWLLSKRLYYGLFALIFIIILASFVYYSSTGNAFATQFIPEVCGWLVTLLIFTVFFDLREQLEWKSVENRVKKRIGKQIHGVFVELAHLCDVESALVADVLNDEAWKDLSRRQLKQLLSEVKLNDGVKELWENRDLASSLASFFDSKRARLSEIEGKYFKFLNSELRASLMDIQDFLEDLRFELRVVSAKQETFYRGLSSVIGKIVKEIAKIREKGIDIGF